MNDEASGAKGFKVSDKRRFDEQGNSKESAAVEEQVEQPRVEGKARIQAGTPPMEITFSSFVISLGTSAMMQLGEMPAPPEMKVAVDPSAARQTIDLLTMLEKKTKGNLDAEEARLLEELLHALRMSYVKHSS